MALPNLLIIGAQKSATTSLHHYLNLHPQAFMSETKELNFFCGPGWSWDRGLEWYERQFADAGDATVRGESSPSYTMHPWVPGVPERIRRTVPDAKLIYVVRDPIERIVSHHVHQTSRGYTSRSLEDVLSVDRVAEHDYVLFSRYAFQLEQYLAVFDAEQILVIAGEDLRADRDSALTRVFGFLGIDPSYRTPRFDETHNVAREHTLQRAMNRVTRGRVNAERYGRLARGVPGLARLDARLTRPVRRPDVPSALRERLEAVVADDARRLRALTGEPFASWSV